MKSFYLGLLTLSLLVTGCSSKRWHVVNTREIASTTNIYSEETSWGKITIEITESNKDKKVPVILELINNSNEEVIYKRDFFHFITLNKTRINTINEFEDKSLVEEDDQSFWKKIDNKYIPSSPLETTVIAGEAVIRKGYFIRDTIYIDSKDLKKHDGLTVIVSGLLVKKPEALIVNFAAK